jgi:thiamine-phosphate pyrophosphorylase
MHPVICMITDGRGHDVGRASSLLDLVAAAARAGVHLIQIREPGLDGRALAALVGQAVAATAGTAARVLVNDRLDVALAARAHGVHLRADSMPAARARALVPAGFVIGRSVHSRGEAAQAAGDGGLDYLMFGTVFETVSKPGTAAAGLDALAAVSSATSLPVLAIGGMRPARLGEVARAGAAGFAAIGLFAQTSPERLQVVVGQAALAFDTLERLS